MLGVTRRTLGNDVVIGKWKDFDLGMLFHSQEVMAAIQNIPLNWDGTYSEEQLWMQRVLQSRMKYLRGFILNKKIPFIAKAAIMLPLVTVTALAYGTAGSGFAQSSEAIRTYEDSALVGHNMKII
jgi:hypothetical protein